MADRSPRRLDRTQAATRTIVLFVVLLAGFPGAAVSDADSTLRRLAAGSGQKARLYRVGLEAAHTLTISSGNPFRILGAEAAATVWRDRYDAPIQVVAAGGPTGEVASVFRVQVGAFRSMEAAEAERRRLERELQVQGVVRHDPDRGNWRVRLGAAQDRLVLQPLMEQLRASGHESLWIAEEPAVAASGVSLRLVDASFEHHVAPESRLVAVPASGGRIEVNGKPYRGVIELRVTSYGTVRAINWIDLEQYLLGVVPAELGPEVWPQLQALQAQAVAARTYAWRNRGQFAEDGYDLCATPRCQVYAGASAEHPLSDRAVAATRGEILKWKGEPIDALYTATCGGHTENGENVFAEHDRPYLRGVPCRAEADAMAAQRGTIEGRAGSSVTDETGREVTRDWALLQAAAVVAPTAAPDSALDGATLRRWTDRLARAAGLRRPEGAVPAVMTLGRAAAVLIGDMGWDERTRVLLAEEDLPALLRDPAAAALPDVQRRALAYLAWTESLRPHPDGQFRAEQTPTAARLAPALARIGETYEAFGLRRGVVGGVGGGRIRIVQGKGEVRLHFSSHPVLIARIGGKPVAVERLDLWPNDRVRFRTDPTGVIDFLELEQPVKGTSDDRSATVFSWEVRRTRRQLERTINRRIGIGTLKELGVVSRGVSGRIVELKIVGSRASSTVRGFDVRRLLDLRESLTVIEIQRDAAGEIDAVVFAGRGWGHGVGLCQVGAYGMALRGADYRQILAHYYRGSRLSGLKADGG